MTEWEKKVTDKFIDEQFKEDSRAVHCVECEESEWIKIAQRRADNLNLARELLVEARGYLDRMAQDGVSERIDKFLSRTEQISHQTPQNKPMPDTKELNRRLWLLRPVENLVDSNNPWDPWYDKTFGFVVCAESEREARTIADKSAGEENTRAFIDGKMIITKRPWLDVKFSTCKELTADCHKGVVIQDYYSS